MASAAFAQTPPPAPRAAAGTRRPDDEDAGARRRFCGGLDDAAGHADGGAVLRAGGNAFDAVVAGQAVLGVVQPASNGVGSDAVLLVYDAKAKKVFSINAEGTAPKLATIEWYKAHNGGKLPVDDSLLAGTVPGVVDAWYILLSRWGTKNFARAAGARHRTGRTRIPGQPRARSPRAGCLKYPTSMKLYGPPDGQAWQDGQVWKNPGPGAHLPAPGGGGEGSDAARPPGRAEGRARPLL